MSKYFSIFLVDFSSLPTENSMYHEQAGFYEGLK